ncbi:hypothetical protein XENTR_v10007816 [Xenopus tropicalis]|nr:hypothetical protein XENTR_v10007816 [Xenopus tropicalis]
MLYILSGFYVTIDSYCIGNAHRVGSCRADSLTGTIGSKWHDLQVQAMAAYEVSICSKPLNPIRTAEAAGRSSLISFSSIQHVVSSKSLIHSVTTHRLLSTGGY